MDGGAGASMSYAMTDMGSHLYIGGHSSGNISIIGASGVDYHYADDDAHKDLYVAKVDAALGEPVAVFLLDGDASASGNVLIVCTDFAGAGITVNNVTDIVLTMQVNRQINANVRQTVCSSGEAVNFAGRGARTCPRTPWPSARCTAPAGS